MVTPSRKAARDGGLLPLNLPIPIAVDVARDGEPAAVLVRGRLKPVAAVVDHWRVDEEWWRQEISREYVEVEFADGQRLTIFRDLITGGWFRQQYTPPARLEAG